MAGGNPLEPPVPGDRLTTPAQSTAREGATREGAARQAAVRTILQYDFARQDLISEALTHRSATRGPIKGKGSNERLEFIGDRVLGLVMAEWLIERFPIEQEGELGRRLAYLVSQPVLAEIAERIDLASALTVGSGEARDGVKRRATVLSDAIEAVIGAMYLDGGIAPARNFIRRSWISAMEGQAAPPKDAKTGLQEWAQARGLKLPEYRVVSQDGPSHAPRFVIEVSIGGQTGTGTAGAKRQAEQEAAQALLDKLPSST